MNPISFIVLAAFPLLAFSDPQSSTSQYNGCDILKYSQTAYSIEDDNVDGPNTYYPIQALEECLDYCFQKDGCKAVNFEPGQCQLYRNGLSDPNSLDSNSYGQSQGLHAYIKCPDVAASGPVGCGKQADGYQPTLTKITRIIGGNVAKPHSWPWQVRLTTVLKDLGNGRLQVGNCGSSLVRVHPTREESDILVTAGHCVCWKDTQNTASPQQYDPSQMTARVGAHDVRQSFELGRQDVKASVIRKHPDYSWETQNDIAVIKLATPIKFSNYIRPICLADATADIPVGKFCAAAGWGRNDSFNIQATSSVLKQLAVQARDAKTCDSLWGMNPSGRRNYNEDQNICAGDLQGTASTCQGDSGGMLACQDGDSWKLYGATSFGTDDDTCLEANRPAVFARVSKYRTWIDEQIAALTSVK